MNIVLQNLVFFTKSEFERNFLTSICELQKRSKKLLSSTSRSEIPLKYQILKIFEMFRNKASIGLYISLIDGVVILSKSPRSKNNK